MPTAPVLLKISGEALRTSPADAVDPCEVDRLTTQILEGGRPIRPVGLVVGGGNIVRGGRIAQSLADPVRGDYMGMLATLINALALADGVVRAGGQARVVGPHTIPNVCAGYDRQQVLADLAAGTVVVFGGGTGHPFFTTDTTAALRAAEIGASALLKASNVDGVYSADPRKDPQARRFTSLTFDQAIAGRYQVMDQTAFALCRERAIPIRVFALAQPGAVRAALGDHPPGTLIHP